MEKKTSPTSFIGEKDIGLLLDNQIVVVKSAKKKENVKKNSAKVMGPKPSSTIPNDAVAVAVAQATTSMTYLEALIEGAKPGPFAIPCEDLDPLFLAIPENVLQKHAQNSWSSVVEFVFDLGRRPYYLSTFENSKSLHKTIFSETVVDDTLLQQISSHVGEFSQSDNRAGISGTLHRISRKLNRSGSIIGLTIRIGRSIDGLHVLLKKELDLGKSILLLGKPGSGKTTLIRDCAKYLSLTKRVEIVDTSNEIAGDGDVPHSAIGESRRMMVPVRSHQHMVMLEAVQNHNPETLVIDEIGSSQEVSAVRDVTQRGVQLIATAHGTTLTDVVNSPVLVKLLGDIHSVILNGKETEDRRLTSKSTRERMGKSCFDIVVEIHKPGCCVVVNNVDDAIDASLKAKPYNVEMRVLGDDHCVNVTLTQRK